MKHPLYTNGSFFVPRKVLVFVLLLGFVAINLTIYVGYKVFKSATDTQNGIQKTKISNQAKTLGSEIGPEAPKIDLLRTLPIDASSDEKNKHEQFLKENARDTAIVFIGADCSSSPTVARIVGVNEMKFINEDSQDHTISIDKKKIITIKPNEPYVIMTSTFTKGVFHSYRCDASEEVAGYVYIP